MKISKLIEKLEDVKSRYGDLPLTTFDGFVHAVKFTPAKDGICYPLVPGEENEIGLEIETRRDR